MNLVLNEQNLESNKIRYPIFLFGIFLGINLFQTPVIGSRVAMILLVLVVLSLLISGILSLKKFRLPTERLILLVFALHSFIITFIYGIPNEFYKYASQIILCILLFSCKINKKEQSFLTFVFLISTVFFSLDGIRYCIVNSNVRYYHGRIGIFGALLDPNFIGLPLVSATSIFLDNSLRGKHRVLSIIGLFVCLLAIVYTSSRGNFLCIVIASVLIIFQYLNDTKTSSVRKIFILLSGFVLLFLIINYFSSNFDTAWTRMTTFGEDADNGRLNIWIYSFEAFKAHPLIGSGFRSMYRNYGFASHNTYIELLVEFGIVGFSLFVGFLVVMYYRIRQFKSIFTIVFVVLCIQIFFLDALDNRCLWCLLGWAAMITSSRKETISVEA